MPVEIQGRLAELIHFLAEDAFHPYLHTKPLREKWRGYYSFRITRNYRCIFGIDKNIIILHTIDHRKDAYR